MSVTKRKPLPYAISGLIDEAIMALTNARRQVRPLLEKSDIDTVARAARALDEINQAIAGLAEARHGKPDEN